MPPPKQPPPRPGSSSRLIITEIDATTAPHTPVPADSARGTQPPPFPRDPRPPPREFMGARGERRPALSNPPPAESVSPPSFRHPEPREKLDSLEISTEALLEELAAKTDQASADASARRIAEERAHAAELRAAAAESGVTAQGPSVSLGSAKWWVLIIGALAVPSVAGQIREYVRPSASAAQIAGLEKSVKGLDEKIEKFGERRDALQTADAARWTISVAFLCSQGFRARGLDCDEAQKYADFQPMPLTGTNKVRGAPQWKSGATWPPVATPKD